jgi:hypothetical protein
LLASDHGRLRHDEGTHGSGARPRRGLELPTLGHEVLPQDLDGSGPGQYHQRGFPSQGRRLPRESYQGKGMAAYPTSTVAGDA